MRVIAGTYRSRQLAAPAGMATRPTSDRLRETLFNVLGPLEGARFADLYAGSGAVGIEALSRGAATVLFSEKAPKALAAVRANLKSLAIAEGFAIDTKGAPVALKTAKERGQQLDIVFLDPPYEAADEYLRTLTLLGSTAMEGLLAKDGLVIAEHARRTELQDAYGSLQRTRTLLQGDAALSFYMR